MRIDRQGQGTVEVALVLPLIVFTIAAMVDFARVYNVQQTMHRVGNVGLNYATQRKNAHEYPTVEEVEERLRSSVLPPLNRAHLNVSRLDLAVADASGRRSVELEMSYLVPFITPIVGAFFDEGGLQVRFHSRLPYPESGGGDAGEADPTPVPTPVPPPAYTVDTAGVVSVNRSGLSARVKVIGKTLALSGTSVPITLQYAFRGTSFMDAFGGDAVSAGREFTLESLSQGDQLAFRARGYLPGTRKALFDVTLITNDPASFAGRWREYYRTHVLRSGAEAVFYQKPEIAGTLAQRDYMRPYLEPEEHTVRLSADELLFVFEFSDAYDQSEADFQDLVLLMQFYDPQTVPAPTTP